MTSATPPPLEPHIVETPGPVRNSHELTVWAAKHPCACGETDIEPLNYVSGRMADGRTLALLRGPCPSCERPRQIRSWLLHDHYIPIPTGFELVATPDPSRVIGPHEFLANVLPADLDADPDTLELPAWDEQFARNVAALRAINELAKFLPAGADAIPDDAYQGDGWPAARAEHPECYTRAWIEPVQARLAAQRARFEANMARLAPLRGPWKPPAPPRLRPFSPAAVDAHRLWTQKGGRGQGTRLEVADFDATGLRLAARTLSGLIADHVTFDRADFSSGDLDAAEWTGCSAREAGFGSTRMAGALLVNCDFERAHLALAKLGDSKVVDCRFDGAQLDRSTWYRAKVTRSSFRGAVFGNAAFDKAVFLDCDFRGADFSLVTEGLLGTIFDARFERCDLRDTRWAGRSLFRARFLHCKLAGSSGPPADVTDLQLVEPDLSPDGTGTPGVTRDDLCRYWNMDLAAVHAGLERQRAYWRKRFIKDGMDPDDPYHAARLEAFLEHPAASDPHFDHDPDDD